MFEQSKKKKPTKQSDVEIVSLSANDKVLRNCMKKAQEELFYLIDFIETHEKNEKLFRYAVKAIFIEEDQSEHMWVQVRDFKDGFFIGLLANEPATITLLKYGDTVKVLRKNVEDWILEDFLTETKIGDFSRNYIRSKSKQN